MKPTKAKREEWVVGLGWGMGTQVYVEWSNTVGLPGQTEWGERCGGGTHLGKVFRVEGVASGKDRTLMGICEGQRSLMWGLNKGRKWCLLVRKWGQRSYGAGVLSVLDHTPRTWTCTLCKMGSHWWLRAWKVIWSHFYVWGYFKGSWLMEFKRKYTLVQADWKSMPMKALQTFKENVFYKKSYAREVGHLRSGLQSCWHALPGARNVW